MATVRGAQAVSLVEFDEPPSLVDNGVGGTDAGPRS